MVRPSQFVDGTRIEWQALAGALFGGVFLAITQSWTQLIVSITDTVSGLALATADYYARVIEAYLSVPARALDGMWESTADFVSQAGLLGFVVAIGIVLTIMWFVTRGRAYLG